MTKLYWVSLNKCDFGQDMEPYKVHESQPPRSQPFAGVIRYDVDRLICTIDQHRAVTIFGRQLVGPGECKQLCFSVEEV